MSFDAIAEFRITNRNDLITDGDQNIGAKIAGTFTGAGAKVMIADLNDEITAETAAAITAEPGAGCRALP